MLRFRALAALLCLGILAALASPAAAVSYTVSYSDPASDVVKLWTSNQTPVRTMAGDLTMSPFPDGVNILWLRSADQGTEVNVSFELKGDVVNLANTTYEFNLYTRSDNTSHFIVRYSNGATTLTSNATGATTNDISGNSTITAAGSNPTLLNKLSIKVSKALLGNVDAWNLDGTAIQVGSTYTYKDFGWELPGNPGSTPPSSPSGSGLLDYWWLFLIIGSLAILAVAVILAKRKKPAPPPP